MLDWRAGAFVLVVILAARPLTVLVSLAFSDVPLRERALVAFTGPRGVVLVAVAGLFGERLAGLGLEDGARIGPLAFALVAATVVLHGFTLTPFARALGLAGGEVPGVLLVGGSPWAKALAEALKKAEVPVLIADPNRTHLRSARATGLPTFFGDILSETAEHSLEIASYGIVLAATDNDAYNTLVATDVAPEFGRENVHQLKRTGQEISRHALPATLGGKPIGANQGYTELNRKIFEGWSFRLTRLTEEFKREQWREMNPEAVLMGRIAPAGDLRLLADGDEFRAPPGTKLLAMVPPEGAEPGKA